MGSLIRAVNLTGFEELMQQLGGDADSLLARYHIEPELIRDPDAYLAFKSVAAVLERAAIECRCPDFGLRLVSWQGLSMLGPLAVVARNTSTVLEAFSSLARYLYVHGPALKLSLRGRNQAGDYCLDYRIDEPGVHGLVQSYELSLGNGLQFLRILAGRSAVPARIYFLHEPLSTLSTYRRAFGCPVEFEAGHCGIDIRAKDMQRPLLESDPQTRRLAEQFLESSQPPDAGLPDRVSELIQRLLATGHCSISAVAEQLAMHPRTLQRALKQANTSYEDLLDRLRQQKAQQLLGHTAMRMSQVAGLLGYTDQSTFNRACRRWFDSTPMALRRKLNQK